MSLESDRLACLDAFRGFDILTMTFVNYVAGMAAIPFLFRHARPEMDAYTLADIVFPGFLFIVGVAIPLSLRKRIDQGDSLLQILKRICIRGGALIFLGVIMVNEGRFSAAATGMSKELWYFLAYLAVIALWNIYPKTKRRLRQNFYLSIRAAAALLLAALILVLRTQTAGGGISWLQIPWWGILGLIGWVYILGSLLYLLTKDSRPFLLLAIGVLVAFSIVWRHGFFGLLGPGKEIFNLGVIIGCHGTIVVSGILVGTLFTPGSQGMKGKNRIFYMGLLGAGLVLSGYLFRPLHGFSKIRGTESYALVTSGICCLVFLIFYGLMDVLRLRRWASFLKPIGVNPLLAYILPAIVDSLIGFGSFFLKINLRRAVWPLWDRGGPAGILNAVAMTALILLITWAMTRAKIVLKI